MRKLFTAAMMMVLVFGLSISAFAAPLSVTSMIGDNDGYGYGAAVVPDGTDLPATLNALPWDFDNRSAAELAATDGSQATDVEDNFSTTFYHMFDASQFASISDAWFTIDISGLQQGVFGGYSRLYFDGVEVTDFLSIDQGAYGSGLFTYAVNTASLADGELDVYFENWDNGGNDHIAIDFTKLEVNGVAAVPEPATMMLLGLGLAGLGFGRKFRR